MTDHNDSGDDGTIKRRTYMSNLGAVGVGLGPVLSVREEGDRKEIVVTRNADGPTETTRVPLDWYRHMKHAEKVADRLTDHLINEPGVASVGIGTAESSIGGMRRKAIEVGLHGDSTPVAIPDRVEGIPVQVDRNVSVEYHCYTGSYNTLKGGISCEDPDGVVEGNICCRVYDGGNEHILTVRHLFTSDESACTDGHTVFEGTSVYRNGNSIGTIADGSVEHDIVWATPDSNNDINGRIVDESAPVSGHVTKSGVSTFASNSQSVDFRGRKSCQTTHNVQSYDNTLSCDSGVVLTELIHFDSSDLVELGDSGGPFYHVNSSGDACITGILSGVRNVNCGGFSCDAVAFGAAAYAINNHHGLTFD